MKRRDFILAAGAAVAGLAVAPLASPPAEVEPAREYPVCFVSASFTVEEFHVTCDGVTVIDRVIFHSVSMTPKREVVSRRRYRTVRTAEGLETVLLEERRA